MKHHATNGYRELRASRDEALRMYTGMRKACDAAIAAQIHTTSLLAAACQERADLRCRLTRMAGERAGWRMLAIAAGIALALLAWRAQG